MEACSNSGSPAFTLVATSVLLFLVARARFWPGLKGLPSAIFYSAAAVVVTSLGWLISLEVCEPGFSLLSRLRLVGVNTVIVLTCASFLVHLRHRQERKNKK